MLADQLPLVRLITLGAGAMDATTGLVLALAPTPALNLFGISIPGEDDILMRFVGAFVAGVGLAYLWALAPMQPAAGRKRLPGVWGATALVRGCVALFCFAAVGAGKLSPIWLVVGGTDAVLAGVQITVLRTGWLEN